MDELIMEDFRNLHQIKDKLPTVEFPQLELTD
jgi:hypothetical protein